MTKRESHKCVKSLNGDTQHPCKVVSFVGKPPFEGAFDVLNRRNNSGEGSLVGCHRRACHLVYLMSMQYTGLFALGALLVIETGVVKFIDRQVLNVAAVWYVSLPLFAHVSLLLLF